MTQITYFGIEKFTTIFIVDFGWFEIPPFRGDVYPTCEPL